MSDLVRRRCAPPSTRLPPAFPGALLADGCGSGRTFHRRERERERRLHGLPRGASGSPASDYGINSRCSVSRWVEQCVNHLSISGNRLLRQKTEASEGGGTNREPLRDEGAPTCTSPQLVLDQQVVHAAAARKFWRVQEDQDDVHVIGRDLSETLRGWRRTL